MPQFISYPIISSGSSGTVPAETSAAMSLYVDAAGSDNLGDGSQANPYLTIQKAVNQVPKVIKHPVQINVGAGNFAGAQIMGFSIVPSGYLAITGTMGLATIATGSNSGAMTSSTVGSLTNGTWATLTKTGETWTVDNLRSHFLRIDSGAGAGQIRAIASNTATVITLPGNFNVNPAAGNFSIVDPTTIITTGVAYPGSKDLAPVANYSNFYIAECSGGIDGHEGPAIYIEQMQCNATAQSRGVANDGQANVAVRFCKFQSISRVFRLSTYSQRFRVYDNYCLGSAGAIHIQGSFGSYVRAFRNIFDGGNSSYALNAESATFSFSNFMRNNATRAIDITEGSFSGSGDKIDGVTAGANSGLHVGGDTTGVSPIYQPGNAVLTSTNITNVGAAVIVEAPGAGARLNIVTGTANTTVISAKFGGAVKVSSTSTITGTTEISIDGTSFTLAQMRAAVPKVISNVEYGTMVYE